VQYVLGPRKKFFLSFFSISSCSSFSHMYKRTVPSGIHFFCLSCMSVKLLIDGSRREEDGSTRQPSHLKSVCPSRLLTDRRFDGLFSPLPCLPHSLLPPPLAVCVSVLSTCLSVCRVIIVPHRQIPQFVTVWLSLSLPLLSSSTVRFSLLTEKEKKTEVSIHKSQQNSMHVCINWLG